MSVNDAAPAAADEPVWHVLSIDAAVSAVAGNAADGLGTAAAQSRLQAHGPNRLAGTPPRSPWRLFFGQFRSLLILLLVLAAALAAAIGKIPDALVILTVLVLNAVLGFYQEYRAEQSLAVLKKMLPAQARVRRDQKMQVLAAEQLVPGDIVLLEAGERVPADGRLIAAVAFEINESTLTGEALPVAKQAAALEAAATPLAERFDMAYMNTMVTRGRGELLVTATGMRTEMGRLSLQLSGVAEGPSPLQRQIDKLGKRLALLAVALVAMLFVMQLLRGEELTQVILDSIALAVAAMPEGLPAVVTVTLALGMRRMAKQRAIVKRLASVETLGCATVICADKTGTLTLNQMTVRALYYLGRRYTVSGEGYQGTGTIRAEGGNSDGAAPELPPLLRAVAACNDSRLDNGELIGDPTEGALLALAAKGAIERAAVEAALPRVAEIPFDSTHKFMATFHRDGDRVRICVKGAPDVLLDRCDRVYAEGGATALDDAARQRINAEYGALAARGLRGLLVAWRELPAAEFDHHGDLFAYVQALDFVAVVGLLDPPRAEARAAIALCREAGIAVKMITGDHKDTAAAIARDLGLHGRVVTGAELDAMDDAALARISEDVAVFARVVPQHKVRIVQALQARGHVVAMTGDGVNDAPALKHADIGVAMGSGTAVTKEAAAMVLTDDNFASIVGAVREGRALYDNILKFIRFQLSTTTGAVLTVFVAPLAGLPEPFTAIQILWVAMIMDGPPAVALALDAARPGIMREPPRRRDAAILTVRRLGKIVAFGVTMMAGTLGILYYGMQSGSVEHALTLAFTTFVLFQFFNVFNARAETGSAFNARFFDNRMLWLSLTGVLILQAVAVQWPPAQAAFGNVALTPRDWLLAAAVAASVLVLEEARKLVARLFHRGVA
jgi:Ca2+-transporting ATPase